MIRPGPTRLALAFCAACCTFVPASAQIDQKALADEADGRNWAAWGRTFSEQRFSPLAQIDRGSVKRLGLAWTLELPDMWNVSTAPVAVDGVIYFAAGYSVVHAVDARTGRLLWKYDPKCAPEKMRMAWGSRGLSFWKGRVYVGVQDGRLVAIDARTGALAWEVQTGEPGDKRYITGAPRVFNDKVLIGHGGADFGGVRGYVTAYDAATGAQAWRWYTVPGDPSKGFENPAMERAATTWKGQWWQHGAGGTVWNAMTYDPEFNRVYLGTGNGSPWNQAIRSPGGGDNLFLCSIVALDADTGEYAWHYQTTPGETWDFNSAMDMVLADLTLDGKPRKALLHAPKNGFFYVLERENGKLVSAEKIAKVTWAERVDLATGRPVEVRGARFDGNESMIWPGPGGAHNWQPMSYSPDTGLTYIPAREMAGYYDARGIEPATWDPIKEGPLGIKAFFDDIPKEAASSSLLAWNPVTQKEAWRVPTPGATAGGVLSTRGGLVFQGRADGRFVAHDADTGAELWSHDLGVGTQAPPITYELDGQQYVAVLAGWAGGQMLMGTLSAQHGWVGREHPRRLLVFALDGKEKLPASSAPTRSITPVDDPAFVVDADKVKRGQWVYGEKCTICHGVAAVAGGSAPDLRASKVPLSAEAFASIVRDGALIQRGMPPFAELGDDDLESIRHFLRERARYEPRAWDQIKAAAKFLWVLVKMKLASWGLMG